METTEFVYKKYTGMTVCMQSQKDNNLKVLHGRAVVDVSDWKMLFLQNRPRGPRSVEVWRTPHSRSVHRPDGRYTLTFRFTPDEPHLHKTLVSEMRQALNSIIPNRQKNRKS